MCNFVYRRLNELRVEIDDGSDSVDDFIFLNMRYWFGNKTINYNKTI